MPGQIVSDLLSWGFFSLLKLWNKLSRLTQTRQELIGSRLKRQPAKEEFSGRTNTMKYPRGMSSIWNVLERCEVYYFSIFTSVFLILLADHLVECWKTRLTQAAKKATTTIFAIFISLTSWSAISFNQTQKDNLQFLRPDEPLFVADCSYPESTDDVCVERERDVWGGKKLRTEDMCLNLSYLTFNIEM